MLGAMPQDEDSPPDDPDDVDPNDFQFFGFGWPSHGPPPPQNGQNAAAPAGPIAPTAQNQFNADLANPAWAPWGNPNVAQQIAQQNVAQVGAQPNNEDEAPPLIPIQQAQGGQPANEGVADHALLVEEVIQVNPLPADLPDMAEEQILAMDDDTDTDSDNIQPVQLPIPPVEIVPFLDFNNLQPLMPKEIQEKDLLGWVNANDNANVQGNANEDNNANDNGNQQFNQNIQLGFVQLYDSWPQFNPFVPCPEVLRLWVQHFSLF